MAAPPSKPDSPSNQPVQQTGGENNVEASSTSATQQPVQENPTLAAKVSASSVSPIEAYENSETSDFYKLAKHLLAEGDFEAALTSIEKGIEEVKKDSQTHESAIAPFHYLYGTTLLYSIEESTDTAMTVENNGAEGDAAADDMQIAWENLEAARILVENLLETNPDLSEPKKMKIQLDLSQIALREGDLQRMNGRCNDAIQDYTTCLKYRKIHLGQYDRKIADAQYNLGLSYLSHSSELQKEESSTAPDTTTTNTVQPQTTVEERQRLAQEHCQKGIELYVDCARTFCGQIALACGVEPQQVLEPKSTADDNTNQAGMKTTGLEDAQISSSEMAQTLRMWRQKVADLSPSVAGGDVSANVEDLKQLLDEIQETVDEAENAQDAVRQASQLKVQAQKAADGGDAEVGPDGSITTIGFGKPTLPSAAASAQPVAASAEQAKPMMVIKKKKKRKDDDEDSKPAASENKRAKTE